MLEEQIFQKFDEFVHKIETLRKLDKSFKLFGSSTHHYTLNAPLTDDIISDFEEKNHITLPNDYRLFLQHVGNGGVGPCYGLIELENTLRHIYPKNGPFSLEESFPHQNISYRNFNQLNYEPEADYMQNKYINGSLGICDEGCGYYDLLVVSGKEKGLVWIDNRCSAGPILPIMFQHLHSSLRTMRHPDEGVDFTNWYESWLNESLEKIV